MSATSSEYLGGCLCGQVRFRITATPVAARQCWCRDCLRLASNGTSNAIFPTAAIEIQGTTTSHVKLADSGNAVTRRFCPACGTQLFSDSTGRAGSTVVRLGTLDDPSAIRPTGAIWTASAPTWACIDPSFERHEKAPPTPVKPG